MAKRNRPKAGQMTKEEMEAIAKDVTIIKSKPVEKPVVTTKSESQRVEIRVPAPINARLRKASKESGFNRTAIILQGLSDRLEKMGY